MTDTQSNGITTPTESPEPAALRCPGCGSTAGPTLKPGEACPACGAVFESLPRLIDTATRDDLATGKEVDFVAPRALTAESAIVAQIAGRIFIAALSHHDIDRMALSARHTALGDEMATKYVARSVELAAKIVAAAERAVVV